MKKILLLAAILCTTILSYAQSAKEIKEAIAEYGYPVNKRTKRISFSDTVDAPNLGKTKLFKRFQQFIAYQDWDKVENLKTRKGPSINTKLYDNSISYKDEEDAAVVGNGYMHFQYGNYDCYIVTFKYKLQAEDGKYKYEFTDFNVLEFFNVPKTKSKGSGMASGYGGAVFASGSSTTSYSAEYMTQKPLEEFITAGKYGGKSHPLFSKNMKRIVSDLNETMVQSL
jgi:hypothetical protein